MVRPDEPIGPNTAAPPHGDGAVFPWRREIPVLRRDVLTASLCINLLSLGLPLMVLQVYDRIIPNVALSTLSLLIAGLGTALVIDALLKVARAYLAGWTGAKFEHQEGVRCVSRILAAPLEDVENTPAGVHLDRLTSIEPVRDFYASQASLALVDLPFVAMFLALMFLIAGPLVLLPVVLLLAAAGIAVAIGGRLRGALAERGDWDDRRYNFIIEAISGIHTIKGLAMERLIQRRYERLMHQCAASGYQVALLGGLARSIGAQFSQVTMVAVAGVGSLAVIAGDLTIGGLAACTLLAGRTVQPVLRALSLWTRFQSVSVAETKLADVAALPAEVEGEKTVEPLASVELRAASFRYEADGPWVLNTVDLAVRPGEMIGVSGGNGVGKTTLLNVLMGRLKVERGALLVNGHPHETYASQGLRDQIAFMPQRPVLFKGTVLDNLTLFDADRHLDQALELAARLGLDQVFARMPDGYDTAVGGTAAQILPAGVAQRIAIARALLGEPRLLLFDEANTALDGRSEMKLKQLLADYRPRAAIVLVSYRPSLLAMADRRYMLAGGLLEPVETAGRATPPAPPIATGAAS